MTFYRTYSPDGDRTGWSAEPQYLGQIATTTDFPLRCECGRPWSAYRLEQVICLSCGAYADAVPISELIG